MRIEVRGDDQPTLDESRDRVRRGGLDPVHLPREKGRGAGVGIGERNRDHLVELRLARLVPVVRERHELGALPRNQLDELPRSGAGGVLGELVPIVAGLGEPGRLDIRM